MREAFVTNIINNIFHVIWFYNLVLEPKYNKKKQLCITVATAVGFQIVLVLILLPGNWIEGKYAVGYLLTAVVFWGMFVRFLSASHPAKSTFLISAYYCLWTFIYVFISLVTKSRAGAGNGEIWGLRICLNLFSCFCTFSFLRRSCAGSIRKCKAVMG